MRLSEAGIKAIKELDVKKAIIQQANITKMTFWRTYKANKPNNNFTKLKILQLVSFKTNIPIEQLIED